MEFQPVTKLLGKQNPAEYHLLQAVSEMMRLFAVTNLPTLNGVLGKNPDAVIIVKLYYDTEDHSIAMRVGFEPQDTRNNGVM